MNTNLQRNLLKRNHSRIRFLKKHDIDNKLSFDEYVKNICEMKNNKLTVLSKSPPFMDI